ncbi:unnamed protein product [Owenia fusiformis]|uniref:Cytochrome P450 n=1 Tax=Owenia fusiformis TaxID=6347 RepID=A0A8S4N3S2_OWEFU|nr:unnamed protein product [Owenia fusiformis]
MGLTDTLVEVLLNNLTSLLIFLIVFLILYRKFKPSPWILPPGPPPKFLVGNMGLFKPDPDDKIGNLTARKLIDMTKEFGSETLGIYFGRQYAVLLHNYDDIQQVFNSEDFAGRSDSETREMVLGGLVGIEGPRWKEQRRFALSTLRDFGLGKNKLEKMITSELESLFEVFDSYNGSAFQMKASTLTNAVTNVICSMVFGHRFEYDDPVLNRMLYLMDENFSVNFKRASLAAFIPGATLLSKCLPGDLFKMKRLKENMDEIYFNIVKKEYDAHVAKFDPENIEDFIDAYIAEIKKRKDDPQQHWFNEDQLLHVIGDLFQAGTDTTATNIRWLFLQLLHHPEIQKKLRQEIHDVIGQDRMPSMRDRVLLPYTEAVYTEAQRMCSLTPISLGNCSGRVPIKLGNYIYPPRTTFHANMYAVHHDPDYWKDPHVFRPERFLDENGKFHLDDHILTFSTGKRKCLGESLARMEIFLFSTAILQRYTLALPEGAELPTLKPLPDSSTTGPYPFDVCLLRD